MTLPNPIHMIGIGGAGMAGLAEILKRQGYTVSGSDLSNNAMTLKLNDLGIAIYPSHQPSNVKNAGLVIYSSAINEDNPEWQAATQSHCQIMHRAEAMGALLSEYYTIAVTGTHGKTTTSALLSSALLHVNRDPSFIIGGYLYDVASHAHLGQSKYFVVEADESDASFLKLPCTTAVITNIDQDHMETYGFDLEALKRAFVQFINQLPENGLAILCLDDPICQQILPSIQRPILTYGLHAQADIKAANYHQHNTENYFQLIMPGGRQLPVTLNLPGRHNMRNALAVIAVCYHLGIPENRLTEAFQHFKGVGRRFQRLGHITLNSKQAEVIEDYAHHPKEINALLTATKEAWPKRRLIAVFQPHRYSRTQSLWCDFIDCFSQGNTDVVIGLPIYGAGEPVSQQVTTEKLIQAVATRAKHSYYASTVAHLKQYLSQNMAGDDIILMIGAGSITQIAHDMVESESITL